MEINRLSSKGQVIIPKPLVPLTDGSQGKN
jgi:hypothetical protein